MERLSITKFQFFGVGVEVGLKVGDGQTVRMGIVNTQSTAYIDVFHANTMLLQQVLKFVDTVTKSLEVAHVQNL